MMGRVVEVTNVDEPDEDTDDTDYLCQGVSKVVQFPLQRCLFTGLRRNGFVNGTNCGVRSGENDQGFACTVNDGCTLR